MKTYQFGEAVKQPQVVTRLIINATAATDFVPRLHEFIALEWLEIANTDLSDLPEIHLPNLRTLILKNNELICLPVAITKWQNLEILWIEEELLELIPEEICDLRQVKHFILKCPKLWYAPVDELFSAWSQLEILNLLCPLKIMPPSITHLKGLKQLYLAEMATMFKFPDIFGELPNLEGLSFDQMGLTSLPPSISSIPKLKWLYVHGCPLFTFPTSLPDSLEELILSAAFITSIPASLFQHPNLMDIDLSSNRIETIPVPNEFCRAPFRRLSLHHNRIKYLPPGFFKLPVEELDINMNPLAPETVRQLKQNFQGIHICLPPS